MVYAMPFLKLASADWMTRSNVRHGCSYSEAVVGGPALANLYHTAAYHQDHIFSLSLPGFT